MRIYYFAHSTKAPSLRYRGKYLLKEVKDHFGIEYTILYPTRHSFARILSLVLRLLIERDNENIYIIQKVSLPGLYFNILSFILTRVKKSVYDIDDAMYELRSKNVVDYLITHCTAVTVGSQDLKRYCQVLNNNTFLLTTALPCPYVVKFSKNNIFTIGWVGLYAAPEHQENLKMLFFPLLKNIILPIRFVLIGITSDKAEREVREYFKASPYIELSIIRNIDWESEDEINAALTQFDIGVMPLVDTIINRSKSAFKLKQYLACGVPALTSDVGDNSQFIKDGENGFLCRTEADWVRYITYFNDMKNEEYRQFIRKSHSGFLTGDFNLEKNARLFESFIKQL